MDRKIQQTTPDAANAFPLRVFFGHHKCATGWIDTILREVCLHMGLKFKIIHQPYSFEKYGAPGALVKEEKIQFLSYINTTAAYALDLNVYRGFHVVRDPRDIVISAYYSHLKSLISPTWDELKELRTTLNSMSKEEGLFFELDYLEQQFRDMAEWDYHQPHILEFKIENLSADPAGGFQKIFEFLEMYDPVNREGLAHILHTVRLKMNRLNHKGRRFMPGNLPMFPVPNRPVYTIPTSTIEEITDRFNFSRLAGGRNRGQENINSHYRKGIHGDWKNHFNDGHIRVFKERYNEVLIKLGYEEHADW